MLTLVTRPSAQSSTWVRELQAHGLAAAALPLIGIAPVDDPALLRAAWAGLAGQQLVLFVSPNAVRHFFRLRPPGMDWPATVLAGAPGPGTARSLLNRGVPKACVVEPPPDSAQFDSESLWKSLSSRDWRGSAVLVVRGDGGRDWLANELRRRGATVAKIAAYRRSAPEFDAVERGLLVHALLEPSKVLWFFSSSEAIDHLERAAADAGPVADWSAAGALVTHPRIAERARALGIRSVIEARPTLADVVACIQACIQLARP